MKKKKSQSLANIKKKYFIQYPEIKTEEIQTLMDKTNDYLGSINLNYDKKIKESVLQSIISLILLNQNIKENEKKQ